MAKRIKSNSKRHHLLGCRSVNAVKALLILFLVAQPGYAGGPKGGGGGGGGCSSSSAPPPPNRVSSELSSDYSGVQGEDHALTAGVLTDTLTGDAYIAQFLNGTAHVDVRLPGYSYFQGLVQADNHVTIAGQVRVVGGILGASGIDKDQAEAGMTTPDTDGSLNLYQGAMVTSNAHAFVGAGDALVGGPPGIKTRVRSWKEIPAP